MKKKNKILGIILILVLLIALALGVVYIKVIAPRLVLKKAVEAYKDSFVSAENITDFSLKAEDTYLICYDKFSVELPKDLALSNSSEELGMETYKDETSGDMLIINYEAYDMDVSLLDGTIYYDDKVLEDAGIDNPEEMVSALCQIAPDSYYNKIKNVVLLDSQDYDFWNIDKAVSFYILGSMRDSGYRGYIPYIYERDDVYAVISCPEVKGRGYIIDMVKADQPNKAFSIIYNTDDMDNIIAFMNSIEFN